MQVYNIPVAYLTLESGILCVRQEGKIKDRINSVVFNLNNQDVVTLSYEKWHWRNNVSVIKTQWDSEIEYISSTFDPIEVLPEYREMIEIITNYEFKFFKPNIITKEQIETVITGEVRLNKPIQRRQLTTSTKWLIENIKEDMKPTFNPIL